MTMLTRHHNSRFSCFLALLWSFGIGSAVAAEKPVQIAVVAPMTGASYSIGVQYRIGVTAAINTFTDGTLLGLPLLVTTHDDQCSQDVAESVATAIASDIQPAVVIGHSCSAASVVAANIYAEQGILQISPASTATELTALGIDTVFRVIGRDHEQGKLAAEHIMTRFPQQRIGIMHYTGAYSRGLATVAIEHLQQAGIEPTLILMGVARANSYAEQVQAFIDADIDVLYMVGGGLDNGIFVRQARLLNADYAIISSDTLISRVFLESAGDAAEHIEFTFPTDTINLPSSKVAVDAIQAFGIDPEGYALLAFAATEVWLKGVTRAQSLVAADVAQALRKEPLETILGTISFDQKGDINTEYPAFSWYQWQDNQRIPVTN